MGGRACPRLRGACRPQGRGEPRERPRRRRTRPRRHATLCAPRSSAEAPAASTPPSSSNASPPDREVTVWERNAPDDTFGFGVVLSDETLGGIEHADPAVYAALQADFVRWDDIHITHRGTRRTSTGHGFAALGRRRLLEILHDRCRTLGVDLRFRAEAPHPDRLAREYDLVVAADGVHSTTRATYRDAFRPRLTAHRCRYIWLAADFAFDAFRFDIAETEHGVMQLHGYPYAPDASTVIVEMREEVWKAAGFDELDEAESTARCAKIFTDALGGRPLKSNKSAWTTFRTVVNARWSHGNVVLLGDAAHRPLLHRLRHQARSGGRPRARRLPGGTAHRRRGAHRLRGGAAPRRRLHPAGGQGQPGMVRGPVPVPGPAAPPVRLQPAHPQSPRHPRQPAAARPPFHRSPSSASSAARPGRPRCSPRSGCAA